MIQALLMMLATTAHSQVLQWTSQPHSGPFFERGTRGRLQPAQVKFSVFRVGSERERCGYRHKILDAKPLCQARRITLVTDARDNPESPDQSEAPTPYFYPCKFVLNGKPVTAHIGTWIVLIKNEKTGKARKLFFANAPVTWSEKPELGYSITGTGVESVNQRYLSGGTYPTTPYPTDASRIPWQNDACTPTAPNEWFLVEYEHIDTNRYD